MKIEPLRSRKSYGFYFKKNNFFSLIKNRKKLGFLFHAPIFLGLWRECCGQKKDILFVVVVEFFAVSIAALFPWIMRYIVDFIIPNKNITLLFIFFAFLVFIAIFSSILNSFSGYKIKKIDGKFSIKLKNHIMRRVQKLDFPSFEKIKTGKIISLFQEDMEVMSNFLFDFIISPFNSIMMLIIAIVSIFIVNYKVGMLSIFFSLILFIVAHFIFNAMVSFQEKLRESNSELNSFLSEILSSTPIIRGFCKESWAKRRYAYNINLLWRKTLYGASIDVFFNNVAWFFYYFLYATILFLGGYYVIKGEGTVGDLVMFVSFITFLFNPILKIVFSFPNLQKQFACANRIFNFIEKERNFSDAKRTEKIGVIKNYIEFKSVVFTYSNGYRALQNLSLEIKIGKITALVGPSGVGKTTIINVLLGFYDITSGEIIVDGLDIRNLNLISYRKNFAFVAQDAFLFNSSIAENISFHAGKPNYDRILNAARLANCHDFIERLQEGYQTVVGERGAKLSAGQKQRIALARAIYSDARIFVFDEITSNLDAENDFLIRESIKNISKEKTILLISHRLPMISCADNIFFINKGRVVEAGTYEDLLMRGGQFSTMHGYAV